LEIVARAHSDEEVRYLEHCGADLIIMGELEIARRMTERVMRRKTSMSEPESDPVPDN
jgi:CPA2 family monovalent cation:H+ antiporter-2